jgi:hypothetical protein
MLTDSEIQEEFTNAKNGNTKKQAEWAIRIYDKYCHKRYEGVSVFNKFLITDDWKDITDVMKNLSQRLKRHNHVNNKLCQRLFTTAPETLPLT